MRQRPLPLVEENGTLWVIGEVNGSFDAGNRVERTAGENFALVEVKGNSVSCSDASVCRPRFTNTVYWNGFGQDIVACC